MSHPFPHHSIKQLPSYSHPHPALHTSREILGQRWAMSLILPPFNYTDCLTNKTSPEIRSFWEAPESLGHKLDANCSSSWVLQTEAEKMAVSYTLKENKGQHCTCSLQSTRSLNTRPLHCTPARGFFFSFWQQDRVRIALRCKRFSWGLVIRQL